MDWSNIILRIGVAFAFLYPPIDAIFYPNNWIDFFPAFLSQMFTMHTLLIGWGIVEVIIALWILSGWKIFWPSICATIFLVAIVFFNLPVFDIVFRDLAIACMALALAVQSSRPQATV